MLRSTVVGVSLLLVACTSASDQASKNAGLDSPSAFGIVEMNSDTTACLAIKSDQAQRGDILSIVCTSMMPPDSTWIVRAEVVGRRENACLEHQGVFGDSISYYDVRIPPTESFSGLGVVTAAPVNAALIDSMHVRVTIADIEYVVYECTSHEGIHFFVRHGPKLIWHEYYYVPYDIEPNCNDDDFKDVKD